MGEAVSGNSGMDRGRNFAAAFAGGFEALEGADKAVEGEAPMRAEVGAGVDATLAGQWSRVRGRLQADVGEVEYRSWLRQMVLAGCDGDEITILLPTRFLRDWVRRHYGARLVLLWQMENPAVRRIDMRAGTLGARAAAADGGFAESLASAPRPPAAARAAALAPSAGSPPGAAPERPATDTSGLDKRFDFDNFVVGKPNEFAYA